MRCRKIIILMKGRGKRIAIAIMAIAIMAIAIM